MNDCARAASSAVWMQKDSMHHANTKKKGGFING